MMKFLFRKNSEVSAVPPFSTYFPTKEDMDDRQLSFYEHFVQRWRSGRPLTVDGNISYVFAYAYEVIAKGDFETCAIELDQLSQFYSNEKRIREYLSIWRSDCFVALDRLEDALEAFPEIPVDSRSSSSTESLLSLRILNNQDVTGRDVLTLFGPNVTKFAKGRLHEISQYVDRQLQEIVLRTGPILNRWKQFPGLRFHPYTLFSSVPLDEETTITFEVSENGLVETKTESRSLHHQAGDIIVFGFSSCQEIEDFCRLMVRQAENALREDVGIPRVGEGWVEETKLYYAIKEALPDLNVEQHARPNWLGRQHYDIWIPSLRVAIEYQGMQHDRPVAVFGGAAGFRKIKRRDARKRRVSKRNGVNLIEVRSGYDFDALIEQVRAFAPTPSPHQPQPGP